MTDIPTTRVVITALDITQEKRDLKLTIAKKEKLYHQIFSEVEALKTDLSEFKDLYDFKIGRLYLRIDELDNELYRYQQISEYVDDIFSFSEAEKVFEEAMKENRERMEEEFKKRNQTGNAAKKKTTLSVSYKDELKRLYRNLALLFHPDKNGGNESMMKRINKAYRDGNLGELRSLELEHIPAKVDDTFIGLEHRLFTVMQLISKKQKEKILLEHSDMYLLRKNAELKSAVQGQNPLDLLASELKREIERKEKEVADFVKKFGPSNTPTSP